MLYFYDLFDSYLSEECDVYYVFLYLFLFVHVYTIYIRRNALIKSLRLLMSFS